MTTVETGEFSKNFEKNILEILVRYYSGIYYYLLLLNDVFFLCCAPHAKLHRVAFRRVSVIIYYEYTSCQHQMSHNKVSKRAFVLLNFASCLVC